MEKKKMELKKDKFPGYHIVSFVLEKNDKDRDSYKELKKEK